MTKSNKDFQKNMAIKIIKENVAFNFAGIENSYRDGYMNKEEVLEMFEMSNFIENANEELSIAMKKGNMLESQATGLAMEAKHLKFLGKENLEIVKLISASKAFLSFRSFIAELKEDK